MIPSVISYRAVYKDGSLSWGLEKPISCSKKPSVIKRSSHHIGKASISFVCVCVEYILYPLHN